jgi:hypothetical protein
MLCGGQGCCCAVDAVSVSLPLSYLFPEVGMTGRIINSDARYICHI